jgi:hypothetical protein
MGDAAGANKRPIAPENQRQPRSNKATVWSGVGRFLDTFDKDAKRRVRPATLCEVRNPAAGCNGAKREWNG